MTDSQNTMSLRGLSLGVAITHINGDEVMSPENLSRRTILAGAASVPALAFPAVVAVAAPVSAAIQPIAGRNPDAQLFELVEQYIAAYAEHGRRIDEVAPFEERLWAHHSAAEKARPEVLRATPADRAQGLPQPFLDRDEDGKERFYDSRTVYGLRKEKWTVVKEANQQGQITIVLNKNVIPSPEARARADEIVQTFDTWFEKYNKRPRGLRAAERRCVFQIIGPKPKDRGNSGTNSRRAHRKGALRAARISGRKP
jgi:hypothetical protein